MFMYMEREGLLETGGGDEGAGVKEENRSVECMGKEEFIKRGKKD